MRRKRPAMMNDVIDLISFFVVFRKTNPDGVFGDIPRNVTRPESHRCLARKRSAVPRRELQARHAKTRTTIEHLRNALSFAVATEWPVGV
jgi:hypothetical protein